MAIAAAALASCPLFAGLAPAVVHRTAEAMQLVALRRREVLAWPGLGATGLGVVLSGSLQAVDETADGKEVSLETVEVNAAFGVAELLAARALPVTWMAAAAGTAVGVLARALALELLHQPEVALRAAQALAQRVCDTRGLQKVLTIHPVSARVCAWLGWQWDSQQGALQLPTHAEIAWQLNTTRESVTRVFQRLQAERVIAREGAFWLVLDAQALRAWGQGRG